MARKRIIGKVSRSLAGVLALAVGGCRMGALPTPTIGIGYTELSKLGKHNSLSERGGIGYTCKAGHIDFDHFRTAADNTARFAGEIKEKLQKSEKEYSFEYNHSLMHVEFSYPENWKQLNSEEKKKTTEEISIELGKYLSFNATTWHEILTWFGYMPILYPEFASAFSWEDNYSNALGCDIAGKALQDKKRSYNEAITSLLEEKIESLGIQSEKVSRTAAEKMRGKWYDGEFLSFVNIKGRNFDIGLDDGFVTPWLVPDVGECAGEKAEPVSVPNLNSLDKYGFKIKYTVRPNSLEKNKILNVVYPDRTKRQNWIEPAVDYPKIIEYIKQDAKRIYGLNAGNP